MSTVTTPRHVLEFLQDVEDYYGKYPAKIKIGVMELLHAGNRWPSPEFLDRLYTTLTDQFSPKWGKVPSKIEVREAIEAMPPAAHSGERIAASDSQQLTDDAGAIPGHYADEYMQQIMEALRDGRIRPEGVPAVHADGTADDRPTAVEFEQRWREQRGLA